MAKVTKRLYGIGDTIVYEVQPGDQGVAIAAGGLHNGFNFAVEGKPVGVGDAWFKQPSFWPDKGGDYHEEPGAFYEDISNACRHLAIDVVNPVRISHVRLRMQKWQGGELAGGLPAYAEVTLEGTPWTPKPAAESGPAQSFARGKGFVVCVKPGARSGTGASLPANLGSEFRQLMVGVNVTEVAWPEPGAKKKGNDIAFHLQTLGTDDVWYNVCTMPVGGTGQAYTSIGADLAVPQMFGNIVRLAWTIPPGVTVTFSGSVSAKTLAG